MGQSKEQEFLSGEILKLLEESYSRLIYMPRLRKAISSILTSNS